MGPAEAALVAAVGMMVQFAQRRAWYQALFNLSVAALTGMTAAVTFRTLVDAMVPNPSIDEVGAALVAVFAAFLVNTGLVAGVLGLAAGRSPLGIWPRPMPGSRPTTSHSGSWATRWLWRTRART